MPIAVVKTISRTSTVRNHQRSIGVDTRLHKGPIDKVSTRTQTKKRAGRPAKKHQALGSASVITQQHVHPNVTVRKHRNQSSDTSEPKRKKPTDRSRLATYNSEIIVVNRNPRIPEEPEPEMDMDQPVGPIETPDHARPNPNPRMNSSVEIRNRRRNGAFEAAAAAAAVDTAQSPPSSQSNGMASVSTQGSQIETRIVCDNCGSIVRSHAMTILHEDDRMPRHTIDHPAQIEENWDD